jgi:hypothetical protein
MYVSLYIERSQIRGVWIAITVLALFVVIGTVIFENLKYVSAAEELNVKVNVGEDDIEGGETQKITVTVTEDGSSNEEISGANVKLTVYPPETDSTTAKDTTDEDGKANFDVKISDDAEYGTYDIEVKVSKDGFNTKTEDSSFEVTGSGNDDRKGDGGHDNDNSGKSKDADEGNKDDDEGNKDDDEGNKDDDEGHDNDGGGSNRGESNNQALSQGNACGNGVLSTGIFCQNIANQLQGDGNAINIIALQNGGGYDEVEADNSMSSPTLQSSNPTSITSVPHAQQGFQQLQSPISGSTNVNSIESIIEQYEQARLAHAIETRLNYLK